MITLKIDNAFQRGRSHENQMVCDGNEWVEKEIQIIKPYDEEKWKDGRIYEFKTLRELHCFCDSCCIDFTDEYSDTFDRYDWEEIDIDIYIDCDEDNQMLIKMDRHTENRF